MDATLLQTRIASARLYFAALPRSFERAWLEQHAEFETDHLPLEQAMALLHPDHYAAWNHTEGIRGGRRFNVEVGQRGSGCSAMQLWGYECYNENLNADHLFPYGLGGPTVSTNKLLLCRWHNTVKSSDVHVYPWERGEPAWLRPTLHKIATVQRRR